MITDTSMASHIDDYEWIYPRGKEGQTDVIRWKKLISADCTPSNAIILGILEIPPGAQMNTHRHEPPEAYYVYDGEGDVLLDDTVHAMKSGSVIFVGGNDVHGVRNLGSTTLRLVWTFAGDSHIDVEYHSVPRSYPTK